MNAKVRYVLALLVGLVVTGVVFWNLSQPGNPLFTFIALEARTYDAMQWSAVNPLLLYSMALSVGSYFGTFLVRGQPVTAGIWNGLFNVAIYFVWYNLALMPNPLVLASAVWFFELIFAVALALTGVIVGGAGGLLAWGTVLVGREIIDVVR
jgi:hypothetical protein